MKINYRLYKDNELVELLRASNKDENLIFSEIYDRFAQKVKSYCKYMISNSVHAEDIFQETFIHFFKNVKAGKEVTTVPGYLLSISRNLCLKYFRDKRTTVPLDNDELRVDESNNYANNELYGLIEGCLPLLDDMYKEAFILREIDGLSYNEVAEVTKTSLNNAKSRVFRAHKQILKLLKPYIKDLSRFKEPD